MDVYQGFKYDSAKVQKNLITKSVIYNKLAEDFITKCQSY